MLIVTSTSTLRKCFIINLSKNAPATGRNFSPFLHQNIPIVELVEGGHMCDQHGLPNLTRSSTIFGDTWKSWYVLKKLTIEKH